MRVASGFRGAAKPQTRTTIRTNSVPKRAAGLHCSKRGNTIQHSSCTQSARGSSGDPRSAADSTAPAPRPAAANTDDSGAARRATLSTTAQDESAALAHWHSTRQLHTRHISPCPWTSARSYSSFTRAPPQRTTHVGHSTASEHEIAVLAKLPYYFETGYALFAKRRSKPFPPPFLSRPSGSFSEPLSTHDRSLDRRPHVNNEPIRGVTNGDDAIVAGPNFVGANDGVGQWATRPRGHAALWSRLILHFWAREVEKALSSDHPVTPDPVAYLQTAYEATCEATKAPEWHGTTTACSALLYGSTSDADETAASLYVTNLGDSQVLVLRPATREVLYKTSEQWHWFDCPRQLGTNSQDTPRENAVCEVVAVQDGDVVLAMSDGVPDNLWEHEISENVFNSIEKLTKESTDRTDVARAQDTPGQGMTWVAEELVKATRAIAEDPFAESPYMERAIEEGLAIEGGKMDDISVVAAMCRKRRT